MDRVFSDERRLRRSSACHKRSGWDRACRRWAQVVLSSGKRSPAGVGCPRKQPVCPATWLTAVSVYKLNISICVTLHRSCGILEQPSNVKGISKYWDSGAAANLSLKNRNPDRNNNIQWVVPMFDGDWLCTGIVHTSSVLQAHWRNYGMGDTRHHDGFRDQFRGGPPIPMTGGYFTDRGWQSRIARIGVLFRYQLRFHRASDEHPNNGSTASSAASRRTLCLFRPSWQQSAFFPDKRLWLRSDHGGWASGDHRGTGSRTRWSNATESASLLAHGLHVCAIGFFSVFSSARHRNRQFHKRLWPPKRLQHQQKPSPQTKTGSAVAKESRIPTCLSRCSRWAPFRSDDCFERIIDRAIDVCLSASAAAACVSLIPEQHVRSGILGAISIASANRAVIIVLVSFCLYLLVSVNQVWAFGAIGIVTLGLASAARDGHLPRDVGHG